MILSEKQLHASVLEPLIGKPLVFDFKQPRPLGSTHFLLKHFEQKEGKSNALKINARCNFQIFMEGLLLKTTNSTITQAIPINFEDILKFRVIRGEETINPFILSPMLILLNLGVPILKARYFRLKGWEYSINKMTLSIVSTRYSLLFEGDGYKFESQAKLFKDLPFKVEIEVY
jgi:hypothetical protein